jgi:hypothetical protein
MILLIKDRKLVLQYLISFISIITLILSKSYVKYDYSDALYWASSHKSRLCSLNHIFIKSNAGSNIINKCLNERKIKIE